MIHEDGTNRVFFERKEALWNEARSAQRFGPIFQKKKRKWGQSSYPGNVVAINWEKLEHLTHPFLVRNRAFCLKRIPFFGFDIKLRYNCVAFLWKLFCAINMINISLKNIIS